MKDEEKEKMKIAKKLFDTPFATTNLSFLKKSQLLILINSILTRLTDDNWVEDDIKTILYHQKYWLIEALAPDFFEKIE